jgi:hypothetical protein
MFSASININRKKVRKTKVTIPSENGESSAGGFIPSGGAGRINEKDWSTKNVPIE